MDVELIPARDQHRHRPAEESLRDGEALEQSAGTEVILSHLVRVTPPLGAYFLDASDHVPALSADPPADEVFEPDHSCASRHAPLPGRR